MIVVSSNTQTNSIHVIMTITYQSTKMLSPSLTQHKFISDPYQMLFFKITSLTSNSACVQGFWGSWVPPRLQITAGFTVFPPWPCSQNTGKGPSLPSSPGLGMRPQWWQGNIGEKGSPTLNPQQQMNIGCFPLFWGHPNPLVQLDHLLDTPPVALPCLVAVRSAQRPQAHSRQKKGRALWLCAEAKNCGDEMKDFTGHKFNSWNIKINHPAREVRLAAKKKHWNIFVFKVPGVYDF